MASEKRTRSMAALDPECSRILETAGFTHDERIRAWFDLDAGRVIVFDGAAERTPRWLDEWLARRGAK